MMRLISLGQTEIYERAGNSQSSKQSPIYLSGEPPWEIPASGRSFFQGGNGHEKSGEITVVYIFLLSLAISFLPLVFSIVMKVSNIGRFISQ